MTAAHRRAPGRRRGRRRRTGGPHGRHGAAQAAGSPTSSCSSGRRAPAASRGTATTRGYGVRDLRSVHDRAGVRARGSSPRPSTPASTCAPRRWSPDGPTTGAPIVTSPAGAAPRRRRRPSSSRPEHASAPVGSHDARGPARRASHDRAAAVPGAPAAPARSGSRGRRRRVGAGQLVGGADTARGGLRDRADDDRSRPRRGAGGGGARGSHRLRLPGRAPHAGHADHRPRPGRGRRARAPRHRATRPRRLRHGRLHR